MARSITYREAINEALAQEMERDERVIVMGEDNAGGEGSPGEADASSPAYRCTNPGMSPPANSSCTRSSNSRIVRITR